MELIDGKKIAKLCEVDIINKITKIKEEGKRLPKLTVIMVGENAASQSYVKSKEKKCLALGIINETICLPEDITEKQLLDQIENLNNNDTVDAILVQLPLPSHIDEHKVIEKIDVTKDVDGFTESNLGKLVLNENPVISCTPKGIMTLLEKSGVEIAGKEACIIGRSNIVGKPLINLLLNANATVTCCHSKTKNLASVTSRADILIVSIGKAKYITSEYVKDGAVVIDVGINRTEEGLVGDVDFDNVKDKCSMITPVPGGVGPMTIISLMANTLELYELHERA